MVRAGLIRVTVGAAALGALAVGILSLSFTGGWLFPLLLLLTSIGTQLLSNNATAVLFMPIAVSIALELGVDPKPFIISICFGASACFASPIGYQTNLLVYGPGNYRFTDYFRLGIPLNLLILVMGSVFIPLIWPF